MSTFIPIGILHSQSGPMAIEEQPLVDAALLAVDTINDRGGVLGREVRPVIADGASDDATFATEAQKLIRDHGVCALFGCWTSSSRKAVLPVVEREDSLLWYPVQYEGLEQSRNIVYTGSCMNQQIAPAVEWALSMGRRRIAFVGSDYVFPRTANKLVASMLAATDARLVYESYHPLTCRDFTSILPSLRASRPDLIINTINGIGNISLLEQLQSVPELAKPDLVCSLSCTENLFSRLSKGAEGQLACWGYFASADSRTDMDFVSRFRSEKDQIPSDPTATAYSQILLWASIASRIESIVPADVRANLAGSAVESPLGRLEIQDNQHVLRSALIGRNNGQGQFDILWQSDGPIPPLPWFGVTETELPYKELIFQVLSDLPEDITIQARLESEIATRQEMAVAMAKNQSRLEETEKIARIGAFERNLKTGEGYWSDMLFQLLGHAPGAFIPSLEALESHFVEEDRADFHQTFYASLIDGKGLDHQWRIQRADGAIRYVQIHSAILRDNEGNIDRYHGTVMDITERALAEEALRLSEREMRLLAETDGLTGIFNRRKFLELTTREIERSKRYPSPFTLIMFDVDRFKAINDTYGHNVGDLVLQNIVECTRQLIRDVDILGRIGGEEFALALPQTDLDGAGVLAERIRSAVEECETITHDTKLSCTISLGVAELKGCAEDVDSILKAADLALYRAKNTGRNRVEFMVGSDLDVACTLDPAT
ncbi:transporter substrate-binding protein [Pseudodesulfovibrio cashew]|nr:transporter substrate-binding protein [Pseudodesulfovibrio cashew]